MTEAAHMLEGRCLCGSVRLVVQGTGDSIEVCHCSMCQRWSGGPLFCLHGLPEDAITITGEEHVSRYTSSEWAERAFCSRCGSNLWYHFVPGGTRALMAGLFTLQDDVKIGMQIFVDERQPWARLAAETPEKTGAHVVAEAKAAGFGFD
ncbi:GFA family protein (plasmid) [Paracoccus liaowanqingii]|uniref:GFA family protein n=1 Tax=Paracoccus liaowanqingii TaxID=2560053 RepID=A0A4Y5STH2_9RHOB|nr:GFA family protein [Paracoccus liaowanqingii]QDA36817.1 GFA family protein [Paracoccus liaowanqingii]